MNKRPDTQVNESGVKQGARDNSRSFMILAFILLGVTYLLKDSAWMSWLTDWNVHNASNFSPGNFIHLNSLNVTWPAILLLAGLVLLIGRRLAGGILIVLSIVFFLPGLFVFTSILAILIPIIFMGLGFIIFIRFLI